MNEVEVRQRPGVIAARQAAITPEARSERGSARSGCSGSGASIAAHDVSDAEQTSLHRAMKAIWHGAKRLLPDHAFMMIQHRRLIGRWPNMRHPLAFNESVLLRCLNPDLRWVQLTDKLAVRDYVREKVGEAHLIPIHAAPEKFTREVFDALPSQFVMKANHGCGFVKVVHDKSKITFKGLSRLADEWLSVDFSKSSRERHYRYIKPRIYFEKLLIDEATGKIPSDIKLHIFGGRPEGPRIHTMVIADRFGDVRGDLYDENWRKMDVRFGLYHPSDTPMPRPENWAEIERVGLRLAEDFGYVRVDLYTIGKQIYFGELTFTPGAGTLSFTPESHDYEWGRMLKESMEGFERMRNSGCR